MYLFGIAHVNRHNVDFLIRAGALRKNLLPGLLQRTRPAGEQGDMSAFKLVSVSSKACSWFLNLKPLAASCMAMALPSPPEPPVTKTVCHLSRQRENYEYQGRDYDTCFVAQILLHRQAVLNGSTGEV